MKRKLTASDAAGDSQSAPAPAEGSSSGGEPGGSPSKLTRAQRAQIERNRQRALMLRQARLQKHPTSATTDGGSTARVIRVQGSRLVDSGGGFFIDEDEAVESEAPVQLQEQPAPLAPSDRPTCQDCGTEIASSFLLDSFDYPVCDNCRKKEDEMYALITRTEAKQEYILKDSDLDRREPQLRYITRRNPHNPRWGQMRLYLRLQVEQLAVRVWGSEEELEKQHELRAQKQEKIKANKFKKRVKELRMAVRSSVYKRDLAGHEHTYGEEVYNEADDTYSKSCTECDHVQTYEKM